jgi:hypothetical protein
MARHQMTRTRMVVLACALIVAAMTVVVIVVSDGDDVPKLRNVALYAPDDTAGLPLLRAVTGAELGVADDPGHLVVYGQDNELRGPAMTVSSVVAEGHFAVEPSTESNEQLVDINGVDGLLINDPSNGVITLSWQPVGVRLNAVNARGFTADEVLSAARAVTGNLDSIELREPERFGLHAIVAGPANSFAGGPFQPGYGGAMLTYGEAGRPEQLIVLTGGEDFAVATMRLFYSDVRDITIGGDEGISAVLESNPDDPGGAIVSWREQDGAVIRVVGLNMPRETVEAVAETVHLISSDEFIDLAEQAPERA